jgi:hypothetical protein
MEQWWLYYKDRVPVFEDATEKTRVEDLTGRNPLLLKPLLGFGGKEKFADVEETFWNHPDLVIIRKHVFSFASSMQENNQTLNYQK